MSDLPDTLAKIFSEYLIRNGLAVQEIADAAGVTRAAVHNWLNGADARNRNLLQLIRSYGLNKISFNDLCPHATSLQREFDPHSLELLARLEAAKNRFEDLINPQNEPEETKKRDPAEGFKSALLKRHGKAIFESAYRDENHEGSLILVCLNSGDAESAEEIRSRLVMDSEYHYLSDMDVMKGLGIVLEEQYQVYLSDIISSFPRLERAARTLFGRSAVLRVSIGEENLQSNEIKLLDFTWERYRDYRDFSPVDYLFYWVSDLDGRSACEKLFGAVKNAIARGSKSLTLAVHDGYFNDEIFTDCEDESGEVSNGGEIAYPTRNDIIRNSIPVDSRLDGFCYELSDFSEVIAECERVKVFICNEDLTANDMFDIPEELPGQAFKFLFPLLGYKLDINCNKGGKGVHMAVITW